MSDYHLEYPNATCDKHPGLHPCYAVCSPIIEKGAAVHFVIPPTSDEVGEILCDHANMEDDDDHDCPLVCALCAAEKGWLSP